MKKVMAIIMLCLFALAFVGTIAASNANAGPNFKLCNATCIDGMVYRCCQTPGGAIMCYWDGPCTW